MAGIAVSCGPGTRKSENAKVMFCIADHELNKRHSLLVEDKLFFRAFRDEVFAVACDDGFELELREFTRLFDQAERRRIRANADAQSAGKAVASALTSSAIDSIATTTSTPSMLSPASPMYISTVQRQHTMQSFGVQSPILHSFATRLEDVDDSERSNSDSANRNDKNFCLLMGGQTATGSATGRGAVAGEMAELSSSYQTISESLYQSMSLDSSLFFAVAREAYELSRDPLLSGRSGNIWRWEGHSAAFQSCATIFARIYNTHVRPVERGLGASLDKLSVSGALAFRSVVRKSFQLPLEEPLSYHQSVAHSESNLELKWIDYYICKDKYLFPEHGKGVASTKCAVAAKVVKTGKTDVASTDVAGKKQDKLESCTAPSSSATDVIAPAPDLTLSYMPTQKISGAGQKSSASKKGKKSKATSATSSNSCVTQNSTNAAEGQSGATPVVEKNAVIAVGTVSRKEDQAAKVPNSSCDATTATCTANSKPEVCDSVMSSDNCSALLSAADENDLHTFWLTQLLSTPTWEADDLTTHCRECHRVFGSLTHPLGSRAHHCRCCGRRLCGSCITKKAHRSFAKLSKPGDAMEPDMRLVCNRCYEQYRKLEKLRYLGALFAMAGLDFRQISLCRTVGWQWRQAAELCISEYRYLLHTCTPDFASVLTPVGVFLQNSLYLIFSMEDCSETRALGTNALPRQVAAPNHCVTKVTTNGEAGMHPEPALLLLRYIAQEKLWQSPITEVLLNLLPREKIHGDVKFSHWHLYCTSFCQKMRPLYFFMKVIDLLRNAPKDRVHVRVTMTRISAHLRKLLTRIIPSKSNVHNQLVFMREYMGKNRAAATLHAGEHCTSLLGDGMRNGDSGALPLSSTSSTACLPAGSPAACSALQSQKRESKRIGIDVNTSNYSSSIGEIEFVAVWLLDLVFRESQKPENERTAGYVVYLIFDVLVTNCAHVIFQIFFSLRTLSLRGGCDDRYIMSLYDRALSHIAGKPNVFMIHDTSTTHAARCTLKDTLDFFTSLDNFCRQSTQPVTATLIARWLHDYCCDAAKQRKDTQSDGVDGASAASTQPSTTQYCSSNNIVTEVVQCSCYGSTVFAQSSSLFIRLPQPLCNPFKPWIVLRSVRITDIEMELSSSRPVWLVFSDIHSSSQCNCPSPVLQTNGKTCVNNDFSAQISLYKAKHVMSPAGKRECPCHGTRLYKFLYKSENVGRDQLMCISARMLQMYLQDKIGSVPITGYSVLPLSPSSGLIEQVDGHVLSRLPSNAPTLLPPGAATSAHCASLLRHGADMKQGCADVSATKETNRRVDDNSSNSSNSSSSSSSIVGSTAACGDSIVDMNTFVKECGFMARESFYMSSKLFLLLNYIFSIGDRHQGNVMLSTTGCIMHIDFQFIFSEKTLVEKIAGTTMRVDDDFLRAVTLCRREQQERVKHTYRGIVTSVDHHKDSDNGCGKECAVGGCNTTRCRDASVCAGNPVRLDNSGATSSASCAQNKSSAPVKVASSKSPQPHPQKGVDVVIATPASTAASSRTAEHDDYFDEAAEWFLTVRPYAETFMQLWMYALHCGILDFSENDLAMAFDTLFDRNASSQTSAANFANTMRYSINVCRLKDVTHNGVQALRSCANCMSRTMSDGKMDVIRSIGSKMWSRWRSSNRVSAVTAHSCSDIKLGLCENKER